MRPRLRSPDGGRSLIPSKAWSRGPLLVAAGGLALGFGGWWGIVRGGDPPEREASRPTDEVAAPVVPSEVMDLVPGCTVDTCRSIATRGGFRFDGNEATLMVVSRSADCGSLGAVSLHFVTETSVLWSQAIDALCLDPVGGIRTDRTGHVFLELPASEGAVQVYVLGVRGDQVDDFGALRGRFRGGEGTGARDLGDDDVLEIVVVSIEPREERVYRWNGREYVTTDG